MNPGLVVSFFTEEGEETSLPAYTTQPGEPVIKTFRETERISAEEEREQWLKWLIPDV